ncbi:MAG: type II toxin-antitoxin system RelE/ParE family toxin [Acidobacteriota bacterium]
MLLDVEERVVDFLQGLPPKQFRQVVNKMFSLMTMTPHDSRALHGSPYSAVDIGEYRICYRVDKDIVRVVLIGKRNDDEVYRAIARLR